MPRYLLGQILKLADESEPEFCVVHSFTGKVVHRDGDWMRVYRTVERLNSIPHREASSYATALAKLVSANKNPSKQRNHSL